MILSYIRSPSEINHLSDYDFFFTLRRYLQISFIIYLISFLFSCDATFVKYSHSIQFSSLWIQLISSLLLLFGCFLDVLLLFLTLWIMIMQYDNFLSLFLHSFSSMQVNLMIIFVLELFYVLYSYFFTLTSILSPLFLLPFFQFLFYFSLRALCNIVVK